MYAVADCFLSDFFYDLLQSHSANLIMHSRLCFCLGLFSFIL